MFELDFELALLDFEKSIQLDTENRSPYYFRAKMYEIQKKYVEQRNDLLFTIEMDPEDPVKYDFALFGLGVIEKV